jgi:transcriptional regulator with XRE-family HTH domain
MSVTKDEMTIKLAENLKRLFEEKNLTVTRVSRLISINKSTLHNYCNGVMPRNLIKLQDLADLLGVSLSELLLGKTPEPSDSLIKGEEIEEKFEVRIRRVR